MERYGLGQPVPRAEDPRLLTGRGRYVDDVMPDRLAHGVVLRSPHAHARVRSIDTGAARTVPGVLAVLVHADYAADGLGPLPFAAPAFPNRRGRAFFDPGRWPLAEGEVRCVGDPVAFVVAESVNAAKEAAETVEVDYEVLPCVVAATDATRPGTVAVWPDCPDNVCFVYEAGDEAAVEGAVAGADHVVRQRFVINRVAAGSMEPRGCTAIPGDGGTLTLHLGVQGVFASRRMMAEALRLSPETRVRVIAGDVGGSFGMKVGIYPEYVLTAWAARRLGRPVKWIAERSEALVSDTQGRDNVSDAELALTKDGRFLALRVHTLANLGAYLSTTGPGPSTNNIGGLVGVYATPAAFVRVEGVFTHTVPIGAYRGAGRPEASYVMEHMIDLAAAEIGMDKVEIRRRNLIPPEAMPYKTPLTFTYDSGHFERNLDAAVARADRADFEIRRAEAWARGRLRGLGVVNCIERAAPPGSEYAELTLKADGTAIVKAGTTDQGQGHRTVYVQMVCERFGLAPEAVEVIEGDSGLVGTGYGTGGSRVSAMGTSALAFAADKVIAKARAVASHLLEASPADIVFERGRFAIAGTDRGLGLAEVVRAAHAGNVPGLEPGLTESGTFKVAVPSFPNGCHACEVEIDPETGRVELVNYVVADDFGTVLNPLLLEGQIHGGVVQGIGQALMERVVYDRESGQIVTGSLADYALPRAGDLCPIALSLNPTPTTHNPMGVKGAGEAGTVGALPATMAAILDALAPLGIRHLDPPATPERLWAAIRAAEA